MKDLFTALGALFLAAEYAFMIGNSPVASAFVGLLAITALVAVRVDEVREEASKKVRRAAGSRAFAMPDAMYVPVNAVRKTAPRARAAQAA
jgi:hypothetical protein